MTKTITINIPKPGDSLPFEVLRNGDTVPEYDSEGRLKFSGELNRLGVLNVARLIGIPIYIEVEHHLPTVAEVTE